MPGGAPPDEPDSSASSSAWSASSSGSRSTPAMRIARTQVRWLRPTCSSSTSSGVTPNRTAIRRWIPIATLHSPMARWPASMSAWVTIPTGLVKSTIQASGAPRRPTSSARSRTTGTVRRALAKPPGPVVSWPMQPNRCGRVSSIRRVDCPPILSWTRTNAAPSIAASRSVVVVSRPGQPTRRPIRPASPATISSRSASMSWRTSSSTGSRSIRSATPWTSSGVYVLPPPMTATFRPIVPPSQPWGLTTDPSVVQGWL